MPEVAIQEKDLPPPVIYQSQWDLDNNVYFVDDSNSSPTAGIEAELTLEDKEYLRIKWGKSYKVEEWIALEKLYNEMFDSYDIQTAGHIDTLKMICKTSLKAN